MSAVVSQITNVSSVSSTVCPGADQRKHQSSALVARCEGNHRWPVLLSLQKKCSRKRPKGHQPISFFVDGQFVFPRHNATWCPGTHLLTWIDFNPVWISNHMPSGVCNEFTYPFPNFNSRTVEVECVSNFIPHFIMDIIICPRVCKTGLGHQPLFMTDSSSHGTTPHGVPGAFLLTWINFEG